MPERSFAQLRLEAQSSGIKDWSKLRKSELEDALCPPQELNIDDYVEAVNGLVQVFCEGVVSND